MQDDKVSGNQSYEETKYSHLLCFNFAKWQKGEL